MKKTKILLIILIPLIILLLALGGVFAYLQINNSPKKIFKTTTSKVFDEIIKKQQNYSSVKENLEMSVKIKSDDEEAEEIIKALEKSKLKINGEMDLKNELINENIKIIYDNENLINADLVMQDQKLYVALKDWFEKYIEIPQEENDLSEASDVFNGAASIDKTKLLESIKQETINVISKQSFTKENVTLNLNGQNTKVVKSSLKLDEQQLTNMIRELLANLKNNNDFQMALGTTKQDVINSIDETLNNSTNENYNTNSSVIISIYTKGLTNKFIGIDLVANDGQEQTGGMAFVKETDNKFQFSVFQNYDETREYIIRVNGETNNNQGIITITIPQYDEELEVVCKYQKNNNQTSYEITSQIEDTNLNISGSVIKEEDRYSGNAIATIETEEYGTIIISCLYNIEYNAAIQSIDVSNSVALDEMTEEEREQILTNLKNSKLYQYTLAPQEALFEAAKQAAMNTEQALQEEQDLFSQGIILPEGKDTVTMDNNKVQFNVSDTLEKSEYNSDLSGLYGERRKTYSDSNLNSVNVYIEKTNSEKFLEDLNNDYILTLSHYQNQEITDVSNYKVNGNEYKYRAITYEDNNGNYLKIYFVYELDNNYIYVVEADIKDDGIELEQVNPFLDITVQ